MGTDKALDTVAIMLLGEHCFFYRLTTTELWLRLRIQTRDVADELTVFDCTLGCDKLIPRAWIPKASN